MKVGQRLQNKIKQLEKQPIFETYRYYYGLTLAGIRIIQDEGWASFFNQFKSWLTLQQKVVKIRKNRLPIFLLPSSKNIDQKLIFPAKSEKPLISIIIPVYNKVEYTINCLKSISDNTECDYEVIIIDDCSCDETNIILSKTKNIRLIKNDENLGFIRSCNKAAGLSRGDFLLFLNNDTMVLKNWIQPLLESITKDNVGAVGSKLIYPDGTLQEAGNIIWKDGSGLNYGRGDDPDGPEYNFVREVDYCSGACLLVKRGLFEEAGGFNTEFRPAYYEDTDLCFSLREMGYKVLYQPKSVVIHFEGVSSGTSTLSGTKRYQKINKRKFIEKRNAILEKNHYIANQSNIFLARNRLLGQNILVVDYCIPRYDMDSGSLRMFNFLKILGELGHKVTFIGDNPQRLEPYTEELQQSGIEVIFHPYYRSVQQYIKQFGKHFDIVILSRPHVAAKYINLVRTICSKAKIVYDTVDLAFLRESRRSVVENSKKVSQLADKLKKAEMQLMHKSDITVVVSNVEKELLLKEYPSLKIQIVSNIHDVTILKKQFEDREGILFVGNFQHQPNIDAVIFFVQDIFPLIKQKLSQMHLYIVGTNPTTQILSLHSRDIIVTGYVSDLIPYFENCRVFVAPLRYGAGVKGKINQSMSFGLPVITTTIGAEGTELVDGYNAMISDNPEDFAQKLLLVYENKELWEKISRNSMENVRQNFSIDVAKENTRRLIDLLVN